MGLFSKFKKRDVKLEEAIDLGSIGVDMHSHLIPGIDDGSKHMDDSLELIRHFTDMGFRKLITTPHIMTDYYKNTPEIIRSGLKDLQIAVKKEGLQMEIEAASEYMLDIGFRDKMESGNLMTFGDKYLLIELSYLNPPNDLNSLIFDLRTEGYKVVLAHPERYGYWHDDLDTFEDLVNRGVHLQLNIISLSGFYQADVMKAARSLIDRGMYTFAASDMHNMDYMHSLEAATVEPYLKTLIDSGKLLNKTL